MTCAVYRSHKTRFCMRFLYSNYHFVWLRSCTVHVCIQCAQPCANKAMHLCMHVCTHVRPLVHSVCATSRYTVQLVYTAISIHSRYKYVSGQCAEQRRYLVFCSSLETPFNLLALLAEFAQHTGWPVWQEVKFLTGSMTSGKIFDEWKLCVYRLDYSGGS